MASFYSGMGANVVIGRSIYVIDGSLYSDSNVSNYNRFAAVNHSAT